MLGLIQTVSARKQASLTSTEGIVRHVNRISSHASERGTSFMEALSYLVSMGDCTVEEIEAELLPHGVIDETELTHLRSLREERVAMEEETEFDAYMRTNPVYKNHPMGIFAEYGEYDEPDDLDGEWDDEED